MIKREMYLERLRPFYDSELIKVVSGVRRCGKSILLKQISQELLETGVKAEDIIFLNFEDYRNRALTDPDQLYAFIEKKLDTKIKKYLLFDEIQNVKNFELVINSFRSTHEVSIFLTGSNSKILSGELATLLGGRTLTYKMMPFSFKEFCIFKNQIPNKKLLEEYTTWGGFPIVCSAATETMKETILTNLYDSIVLKDIIMRNKISSVHALEKIVNYLIASSSLTLSGNTIAQALQDENQKTSLPTVYDYIRYITDACIVSKVERYDIRGKRALAFEEKCYVSDLGIFHLKKNRIKDEFGIIMKTLVYNELIARGYSVYIGKTYRGEVDFIAYKNQKKCYIQVAYLLSDPKTVEREFGAFLDITDNYPKYVISYDDWTQNDKEGIIHMSIMQFLTGDTDIL